MLHKVAVSAESMDGCDIMARTCLSDLGVLCKGVEHEWMGTREVM